MPNGLYDWNIQTTGSSYFSPQAQQIWIGWQGTQAYVPTTQPITMATNTSSVWNLWIDNQYQTTSALTPAQQYVWSSWYDTPQMVVNGYAGLPAAPRAPLSEEEQRKQLAQVRRSTLVRNNRARASMIRRKMADRRARELLLEFLDEEQAREYESTGYFHVVTAGGLRKYRINKGHAGNIRLVEVKDPAAAPRGKSGYPLRLGARFCMHGYHPDGPIPDEDHMLAQKLLLEADEAEFLALANVS